MTDLAAIKADLEKAQKHEELLQFNCFDENTAWQIGSSLRAQAEANSWPIIIDIRKGDDVLFFTALPGTAPTNADWARRKRNFVNILQISSYQISRKAALGENLLEMMALDPRNYTPHGGSFPIRVRGTGMVGTVTVSGLPQRDDHKIVVDTIASFLNIDLGASAF